MSIQQPWCSTKTVWLILVTSERPTICRNATAQQLDSLDQHEGSQACRHIFLVIFTVSLHFINCLKSKNWATSSGPQAPVHPMLDRCSIY